MNYVPFASWWFYGEANAAKRAAYLSTWGLIDGSNLEELVIHDSWQFRLVDGPVVFRLPDGPSAFKLR